MLLKRWWWAIKAVYRLRGYEPKKVTFFSILKWSRQFPRKFRGDLLRLAATLEMLSEGEVIHALLELNKQVVETLKIDGVEYSNVIYITTDSTGSSSGVMLDLLKRRANLGRTDASFLHAGEGEAIQGKTMMLQKGAIIYVDDFAGTGKQFSRTRQRVAEYIVGSFSEFFLVPCICEEALARCHKMGVEAIGQSIHLKQDRPLHKESNFFSTDKRNRLLEMCRNQFGRDKISLGFDGLATNVVVYRNAPNTTPLVLRGHLGQKPIWGIVPRFDDLE